MNKLFFYLHFILKMFSELVFAWSISIQRQKNIEIFWLLFILYIKY